MTSRRRVFRRAIIGTATRSIIRRSSDTPYRQHVACPTPLERHPELRRLSRRKLANAKERALAQEGPSGDGRPCLCKAFSHLQGSETTLDCQAADRAAVECPDSPLTLPIDDEG